MLPENLHEQLFLVLEIGIEAAHGDAGRRGDLLGIGTVKTVQLNVLTKWRVTMTKSFNIIAVMMAGAPMAGSVDIGLGRMDQAEFETLRQMVNGNYQPSDSVTTEIRQNIHVAELNPPRGKPRGGFTVRIKNRFSVRSLTPPQAARNALAIAVQERAVGCTKRVSCRGLRRSQLRRRSFPLRRSGI